MSVFPTPWTVEVLPYEGGSEDAYGNSEHSWGSPVERKVHGWSPPNPDDWARESGVDRLERDLELLVPVEFEVDPRDHVLVKGTEYKVAGNPQDYSHGPFGFDAGMVVPLLRAEARDT